MDYDFEYDGDGLITRILYRVHDRNLPPVTEYGLAGWLGYSARHIRREFVSVMGEGPAEYAHRVRFGVCGGSPEPVRRAGEVHCGGNSYRSRVAFTTAFHGHFGVSPTGFRELNSGEAHVFPGYYAVTGVPEEMWPREVGFRRDKTFITTLFYNSGIVVGQLP